MIRSLRAVARTACGPTAAAARSAALRAAVQRRGVASAAAAGSNASDKLLRQLKDKSLVRTQCYVNGQWVGGGAGAKGSDVLNPATNELVCRIPVFGAAETRDAIAAAEAALPAWRARPAWERAAVCRRFGELIHANAHDLGVILTTEQGKPLGEAKGEVGMSGMFFEWFAEEAKRVYGDVVPGIAGTRFFSLKQPVGVVGMITPWNFPSSMIARKLAAALAAGCTSVLKPSEFTPLSAFALAEIGARAGVPAGVFNVVTGDPAAIGGELTANTVVRKISFTGSTRVGKLLLRQSADTVKKVSMELGGNAPFIVFNDADLERAAAGVVLSKFRNAGQTCVSANRVFVQSGVYDKFASIFADKVKALRVGDGLADGVSIGPLINSAALRKVTDQLADAKAKGATVLCGGAAPSQQQLSGNANTSGHFFLPTVLLNATRGMACFDDETFGPLAPLFRFESEQEVVRAANDTRAGLAAYFYTNDPARQWRMSESLEYGMVACNTFSVSHPAAPFGGVKESGVGREGSKYGIDDYTVVKAFHLGGM